MESEIQEIHTKREEKTQTTTIRIFLWKLQYFCMCIQFSFRKLQIKFRTAKIVPLHFFQHLIHLELLIFIQVRVPSVWNRLQCLKWNISVSETDYNNYKWQFRYWNRLQWLTRKCLTIGHLTPLTLQLLSLRLVMFSFSTWSAIFSDTWTSFTGF